MLIEALPTPMAKLPDPKAIVDVGPPLFWSDPRFKFPLDTFVAHEGEPIVTRLLLAVAGERDKNVAPTAVK